MSYKTFDIEAKHGDRRITLGEQPYSGELLEIRAVDPHTGEEYGGQFAYLTEKGAVDLAKGLIQNFSIKQEDLFGKPLSTDFTTARGDLKTNAWRKYSDASGYPAERGEMRHREQVAFWRNHYISFGTGKVYDMDAFDKEFGLSGQPEPKNARDIIATLKVGSTFTLRSSVYALETRYFRIDKPGYVHEYTDQTFEKKASFIQPYDLKALPGTFSGWSVPEYAAVNVVKKTAGEIWDETWESMAVGDTFHFSDNPYKTHVKVTNTRYYHDGTTRDCLGNIGDMFSNGYTIVPKKKEEA